MRVLNRGVVLLRTSIVCKKIIIFIWNDAELREVLWAHRESRFYAKIWHIVFFPSIDCSCQTGVMKKILDFYNVVSPSYRHWNIRVSEKRYFAVFRLYFRHFSTVFWGRRLIWKSWWSCTKTSLVVLSKRWNLILKN